MRQRLVTFLALLGFVALASGVSFAAHMRQESCHGHDHSAPEAPHSPAECPICQGLAASSTVLVGGMVVVVAPVEVTVGWSHAPIETLLARSLESPASPRAPPAL